LLFVSVLALCLLPMVYACLLAWLFMTYFCFGLLIKVRFYCPRQWPKSHVTSSDVVHKNLSKGCEDLDYWRLMNDHPGFMLNGRPYHISLRFKSKGNGELWKESHPSRQKSLKCCY